LTVFGPYTVSSSREETICGGSLQAIFSSHA
jgi:hypothetical protein